jgi:hypothetical protein
MPRQIAGNLIARITSNRAFSHSLGHYLTYAAKLSITWSVSILREAGSVKRIACAAARH